MEIIDEKRESWGINGESYYCKLNSSYGKLMESYL